MIAQSVLSIDRMVLKTKQFAVLLKFRLSFLVVFSGGFGYILAASEPISPVNFLFFCLGSFLITGSANTINQIIERESDKLMKRTADRPLPTGRLSISEAALFSLITGAAGLALVLIFTNILAASLALLSLLLYGFAYTPLKSKSSIAVFVGAIPGALPPLIGWAACAGSLGIEAFLIFAIQFIWQFPHFWAIAWVAQEDYAKAGIYLLPSPGGKNWSSAFQIMTYTLFLIPIGLLPYQFGMTGPVSAVIVSLSGLLFLIPTLLLMKDKSQKAALRIMFSSFLYLPVVQLALLFDKI